MASSRSSAAVVRSGNSAMKVGVVTRDIDYLQYVLNHLYLLWSDAY